MKNLIDDGFSPDLVELAEFRGNLEIPTIHKPDKLVVPTGMIPYSQRRKSINQEEFVAFYEYDKIFSEILIATKEHVEELRMFPGIISPDCSLYRDMPLCVQVANIYMSRAVGHYFQSQGLYVIPNVRWGDERTYTTVCLPEKVAFLGVDKHSIVSIGTYGCIRGKENQYYFREGLIAMLDELEPEIVLVYGSMPDAVFDGLRNRTWFVQYPDWIALRRKKVR